MNAAVASTRSGASSRIWLTRLRSNRHLRPSRTRKEAECDESTTSSFNSRAPCECVGGHPLGRIIPRGPYVANRSGHQRGKSVEVAKCVVRFAGSDVVNAILAAYPASMQPRVAGTFDVTVERVADVDHALAPPAGAAQRKLENFAARLVAARLLGRDDVREFQIVGSHGG